MFLGVAVMASENIFVYVPILLTGFMVFSEVAKKMIDRGETVPMSGFLKKYLDQGVHHKADFIRMRNDSEVYLGFYFVIGAIVGMSSFLVIIFYGQIMRVKYMISSDTK
jgi:hypothetical protein